VEKRMLKKNINTRELKTKEGDKMKKKNTLVLFVVFLSILSGCQQQSKNVNEPGVVREFSKGTIQVGESINVKLHVNLMEGQTYYLIDEAIPNEFEVIGEKDSKNHIKIAVIQDAKSTVYEYTIKPTKSGEYIFDGDYVFEGMNPPIKITGDNKLIVK
jgi:hypothetical protein